MSYLISRESAAAARKELRTATAAADNFIRAATTNDGALGAKSLHAFDYLSSNDLKRRFWERVLGQQYAVDSDFRFRFLAFWKEDGGSLRDRVDDDLLLFDLLRRFLPPYDGPALELYRGETEWNSDRQTYGPAWSADREAATCFAQDKPRLFSKGGSVLIRTTAPPAAIICAPHLLGAARPAEAEYIVDRRDLNGVTVLDRFGPTLVAAH